MDRDAGLTEDQAKREMARCIHEDHGATSDAYPGLRLEFGVLYRDMSELPMRQFRGGIYRIERICRDIERGGSPRPCWYCGRRHEGWVCPVR